MNLRMSAGVSITVCVFLQPALQLFPVSYHTALKVAELCMCVYVCVCACTCACVLKVTAAESFLSHYNNVSLPRRGEVEAGIKLVEEKSVEMVTIRKLMRVCVFVRARCLLKKRCVLQSTAKVCVREND